MAVNLLERVSGERYQFPLFVRVFARERLNVEDDAADIEAAIDRLTAWMANTVNAADRIFAPLRRPVPLGEESPWTHPVEFQSYDQALAWCDAERFALLETVKQAAESGRPTATWRIALGAVTFYKLRNHRKDWLTTSQLAVNAARAEGDRYAEAWSLISLGGALVLLEQFVEAGPPYEEALEICRAIGDRMGEGMTLGNLGELACVLGNYDEAIEFGEQAIAIWREIGERRLEAIVLIDSVAQARLDTRRFDEAVPLFQRAQEQSDGIDLHTHGLAVHGYARALEGLGDLRASLEALTEALNLQRRSGDRAGLADTLLSVARVQSESGHVEASRTALREALEILTSFDDPRALAIRDELDSDRPGGPPTS
ncbi:tetratricopeptide repeat protein [Cryptosporangium aurantiacum]|uniref:tetratricopeptide repeat protein n=1 Tax=Cryptosporangium aurantiacum TaxID=134849 RepID=UPI000932BB5D|nr:tetratricopeptide repeat protein [Cryptosporangium aurantiacum]